MSEAARCWIDGRPAQCVSPQDRGLHYGDGVFETVAVAAGEPLLWDRHLARLARGAERLGLALPPPPNLTAQARECVRGVPAAVLKLIVTRGVGARGYSSHEASAASVIFLLSSFPKHPVAHRREGVRVRICATRLARQPRLAGIKHLNCLERVLARAEWRDEYAEGLMLDDRGYVIEGTMTNIFMRRGDDLLTPDLSDCGVEGVMREAVMERAGAHGLRAAVAAIDSAALREADEIFLTNSIIGLWPVRELEGERYAVGEAAKALQAALVAARALYAPC